MSNQTDKILNVPNCITLARIFFIPAWLFMALVSYSAEWYSLTLRIITALLFIALSFSDKLDGYYARKYNQITNFGKFLDPIADKLLVVVALMFLLKTDFTSIWVPTIILAREFLVSALRMVVAAKGVVVSASNLGKAKTAVTLVAISILLVSYCVPFAGFVYWTLYIMGQITMLAAVLLTVYSGYDYFRACFPYLLVAKN